jgi:hypothetical protein
LQEQAGKNDLPRLAVCAILAGAAVYGGEKLGEGCSHPLWEKYGPWLKENKVQAILVLAVIFYALSLILWPEEKKEPLEQEGYEPCQW